MTTALELVGAFLSAATLLTAAMFLVAFHLGRLITRDDEQGEVEFAWAPEMAVHDLVMSTACSRRTRSGTSTRPTGPRAVKAARAAYHPRARWRD